MFGIARLGNGKTSSEQWGLLAQFQVYLSTLDDAQVAALARGTGGGGGGTSCPGQSEPPPRALAENRDTKMMPSGGASGPSSTWSNPPLENMAWTGSPASTFTSLEKAKDACIQESKCLGVDSNAGKFYVRTTQVTSGERINL